ARGLPRGSPKRRTPYIWRRLGAGRIRYRALRALTKCGAAAGVEVGLPEVDAVVAQDRVGGRGVKERVGDDPARQVFEPSELQRTIAQRHLDVAILGALESARGHALDEVDRPRDTRAQLLERLLVVLEFGGVEAGEPRHAELAHVAGDLHLTSQGQHVRGETRIQQHRGLDLSGGGTRESLVENV